MDIIREEILNFLNEYNINNSKITYLVGFSGGYDSMCLLHSLKNVASDNRIVAIHLNHSWRNEESDIEEDNCKEFCQNIGVEFYSEKIFAPQNETESRDLRYKFFEKCSKIFESDVFFTAHNKNDNAETVIFRICHGTGIKGLCGIAPKRDIFYRPLLNIDREKIENYCQKYGLHPNNDSSNHDNIHKRNLIRNEIIPKFKEINSEIINSICSLSSLACSETAIVNEYISEILPKISENGKILTQEFIKLSDPVKMRILYEKIIPLVPQNYDKQRIIILLKFIEKNFNSKSGKKISITTKKWLFVSEKYIDLIESKDKKNLCIKINKTGEYENDGIFVSVTECNDKIDSVYDSCGESVWVDFSGLNFDFELRTRQDGDIIQPLGMQGHKKLKKFLNEKKIPNHQKEELLFLAQGKEILWAVGIGLSEKISVKNNPTHKICVKKEI